MFSTTVVTLVISLYAVEILAVDESCVTPSNTDTIENCCDLGFRQTEFSESLKFTNLKASAKVVAPHPPLDIVTQSLMEEDGWWYREECQMDQKIFTETGMIMRWDLEALQVNYGMDCMPFTA